MPKIEFVSESIALSTTVNVLRNRAEAIAPYPRTIQALASTVRDNTPALGDITWRLRAGQQIIAEGRGILENTAGPEITWPDGYTPVGMTVAANVPVQLEVTNADAAAAHSSLISIIWDQV